MGSAASSSRRGASFRAKVYDEDYEGDVTTSDAKKVVNFQANLQRSVAIPIEIQVAHFTPSSFPLLPILTKETRLICEDSWNKIVCSTLLTAPVGNEDSNQGGGISGMTVFYNEFYQRLEQFDSNGKFDAVLSRHSVGMNKIAAKGAILLRIIKFVLKIEPNSKQSLLMIYMLGKSHTHKGIRPWQYAVFVQVMLLTIASRLGNDATIDVMEAWVNLFAYVMKSMLPAALKGQVVETEMNINTSAGFDANRVEVEVEELEEIVSRGNSMHGGSVGGSVHSASGSVIGANISVLKGLTTTRTAAAGDTSGSWGGVSRPLGGGSGKLSGAKKRSSVDSSNARSRGNADSGGSQGSQGSYRRVMSGNLLSGLGKVPEGEHDEHSTKP